MALTENMEQARALVDIEAHLKKADLLIEKHFPRHDVHVRGWDNRRPGSTSTVRPKKLAEDVKLVEREG